MWFRRELSARPREVPKCLIGGELLRIDFEMVYSIPNNALPNGDEPLFTLIDTLNLEWNETGNVFIPHTSADNPARIEEIWTDGAKEFVAKNIDRLRAIAQTGTPSQREVIQAELLGKHT